MAIGRAGPWARTSENIETGALRSSLAAEGTWTCQLLLPWYDRDLGCPLARALEKSLATSLAIESISLPKVGAGPAAAGRAAYYEARFGLVAGRVQWV